ncbi:hypothetical protein [[Clostridium] innocuum]|uniref:hypothetical protein n=1 Tax=Clostridium innocuum TaxID=1522 RepID=UPI003A4E438F
MEASIILTKEDIKKAFVRAHDEFLSYLDERIKLLHEDKASAPSYEEALLLGRDSMDILLPLFIEVFDKTLCEIGRTTAPLLAVALDAGTSGSKKVWQGNVLITEEFCKEIGIDYEKVVQDLKPTVAQFGKLLAEYHRMMGDSSKMSFFLDD